MSGSEDNTRWTFDELRKFPLMTVDSPNFESVTFEKLKSLSTDKPIRLQSFNCHYHLLKRIELCFTDGLESAVYQLSDYKDHPKSEMILDARKQIKKISIRLYSGTYLSGMNFLDEKDNEIVKWDNGTAGTWQPAKELPDGFEIIGIYGDTRKDYTNPQFGFLLWNPKLPSQN